MRIDKEDKGLKKRAVPVAFAVIVIILAIVVIAVGNYIEKRTPSKRHVTAEELSALYGLNEDSVIDIDQRAAIILQNTLLQGKALVENGVVYLDYDFIKEIINDKFYWDDNENILIYTTPTDIIKADVGSQEYYVTKAKNETDYTIVKTSGSQVYIALEFVKLYSNIEYEYYDNPARVIITNEWDVTLDAATLKKDVKIRKEANIKSDIIYSCVEDTEVIILSDEGKWSYVITNDGYFGYVKNSSLTKKTTKTLTSDFVESEYTGLAIGGKISMAWHMVTSEVANGQLIDLITPAKGLNVVAPTWYRLSDNEGNMTSLADANYVTRAHLVGLNVWAMVDDQSENSINREIFPYTSKRERIINQLVASAIEYGFDGINIDFEYITEDIADDYIQFIRELSVKCRINGIILSVDCKVPEASNEFYNFKAQGEVVDYMILMAYDEHYGTDSGAGSVASLPWVTNGVINMIEDVQASKVVLALPFYTRIWTEDPDGNVIGVSSVDMDSAISALASAGVEAVWVDNFGQNYGEYNDADGNVVRIWLEDSMSLEEKLKLINTYNIAGISCWRLGLENNDIWNLIIKYTNN